MNGIRQAALFCPQIPPHHYESNKQLQRNGLNYMGKRRKIKTHKHQQLGINQKGCNQSERYWDKTFAEHGKEQL